MYFYITSTALSLYFCIQNDRLKHTPITNSSVEKFDRLKRDKESIFKTINLCKIKTNVQTYEEENIKKIE